MRLVEGDGASTLDGELAGLTEDEVTGTFLHVDPYRPLEPGPGGQTPLLSALHKAIAGRAWFVEVYLLAEDPSEVGFDPGVLGCGIVACNFAEETLAACRRLGEELAYIYTGAKLPNGCDGTLEFEEGTF